MDKLKYHTEGGCEAAYWWTTMSSHKHGKVAILHKADLYISMNDCKNFLSLTHSKNIEPQLN